MSKKIKLIIVDFYGVMTRGSYKDTCRFLAKKYKMDFQKLYKIFYHKYFILAVKGKISEKESFELAIKELGLREDWRKLRRKHLSFQKLNKSVFNFVLGLQKRGYLILLLSQNTSQQFKEVLEKMKIQKYFKHIISTYDFRLPKRSKEVFQYIFKKFNISPQETVVVDDQEFNLKEPQKMGCKIIFYKNFKDFKKKIKRFL